MIIKLCFLIYLLFSVSVNAMTLKETVAKALEYSPNLKAIKSALSSSKAQRLGAYLDLLPKTNASYTKTNLHRHNHTAGTDINDKSNSKGISVETNIFKGGASLAKIKASVINTKIAELTLKKAYQDTIMQATTNHVNYLLAEEGLKLAENQYNVLKKNYESTKLRFDLGELTKTDVAQAQARLSSADSDRTKFKGNLEVVRSQYFNITGVYPDKLKKPDFPKILPVNLEEAMTSAKNNNKDLLIANLNERAASENIKISWSQIMPSVDLIASINKYSPSISTNNRSLRDKNVVLQVRIPVFQGGTEYTNIADQYYSKEKAKYNYLQTLDNLITNVRMTWTQLETTKSQIASSKASENAAKLAYEGVTEEAKIGLKTTLDVLNAEQEFYNDQLNTINADYQTIINSYKLLSVIGRLELDSF